MCDAVALDQHTALQEQSIALLRHIGWEGVAMVEYRWDAATGAAVLMEINGRYWGSYPLAMHCNAGFALISYSLESGLGLPLLPTLRTDLRCRMVVTEVKRLVRIFLQPALIVDRSYKIRRWHEALRFVLDFFRPKVRYYVWDRSDPRPFVTDGVNLAKKVVRRR